MTLNTYLLTPDFKSSVAFSDLTLLDKLKRQNSYL